MKVCFVILHYLTGNDTIECVHSILDLEGGETASIIIVDNFSNNGSVKQIREDTDGFQNVVILANEANLGFAQGNNVGYRYAKAHWDNPFVIILNNDTLIRQHDFITRMLNIYQTTPFHVLGPDIISLIDGGHQNPMQRENMTKQEAVRSVARYSLLLFISRIGIYGILKKNKDMLLKKKNIQSESRTAVTMKNRALHGSCLIFSPDFVREMDVAFSPDTFLYMEEMILSRICQHKGFTMRYDPSMQIYHKEDSSTNAVVSSEKKKREFLFRNLIRSGRTYIKQLDEVR